LFSSAFAIVTVVFNSVTLDGYFTDKNSDMSWAHKNDPEWNAFVADNAKGGGTLLFGRITYELMASFWPTPAAMQMMPDSFLPNFLFGERDTVVVLGQDGLVANTVKYLSRQPVIGVNPDPQLSKRMFINGRKEHEESIQHGSRDDDENRQCRNRQ